MIVDGLQSRHPDNVESIDKGGRAVFPLGELNQRHDIVELLKGMAGLDGHMLAVWRTNIL